MKPTEELKNKVNNATDIDLKTLREWAELLLKIPIYQDGWTSVSELTDIMNDGEIYNYEELFVFRISVELEPTANHGETVVCIFKPGNEAEINSAATCTGPTEHLETKEFFGFKGTWEQVVEKIVEINNFLTQPAPPLKFELKQ